LTESLARGQAGAAERSQGGNEFLDLDLVAVSVIGNELAQLIERDQKNADRFRAGNHLPGPDQVESVLRLVRQFANIDQVEEAGAAFDGVGRAEDPVDQVLVDVGAALLNGQQVRLDGGQMFAAFGQIVLYQLVV
jgi:hypothetical protein